MTIRFEATPYTIGKSTILRLPEKASLKLPSRGQVAVRGTINDVHFRVIDAMTSAVVLDSACYQYTVSQ